MVSIFKSLQNYHPLLPFAFFPKPVLGYSLATLAHYEHQSDQITQTPDLLLQYC